MMINEETTTRSSQARSRRKAKSAAVQPPVDGDASLPSRRVKHPSNKQQMASWFYNTLIVLFLVLAAGLFFFGRELAGKQ